MVSTLLPEWQYVCGYIVCSVLKMFMLLLSIKGYRNCQLQHILLALMMFAFRHVSKVRYISGRKYAVRFLYCLVASMAAPLILNMFHVS